MADVRVKISSADLSLSEQVIEVVWDTIIQHKKERDSRNYTANPKSEMILPCAKIPVAWAGGTTDGFDFLIAAESDCNNFDVSVEVFCGGVWSEQWAGSFTSQEWRSDRVKKIIQFKPKESSPFDCLKENWKLKKNPFSVSPVITVKPYELLYEHHEEWGNVSLGLPCDSPPIVTDYCLYATEQVPEPIGGTQVCFFLYHRYRKAGTCSGTTPVVPDSWNTWNLLTDNCPTSSDWWACPAGARLPFNFGNGRMLEDVLQYLFDQTGCGLTVKSDFFGILPDGSAPSNSAYTAASAQYQNLVVFQKSDIKRHDASNQSTSPAWEMKLYDLLNDLKILFNLDWQITESGTVFRLEHVSFFEAGVGNNYTSSYYKQQLEQEAGEVAYINKFLYRDEACSGYFKGQPIIYYCGEDEEEVRLSLFSCDLKYIEDDNQAENIGDDGFFLMATVDISGTLYNVDDNRPMAWTELHNNFYKYNMPGAGEINGSPVTPLSVRPTKKQPAFTVKHCCDDTIDVAELQTTSLGNGEVQEANHHLTKETLQLELKY